MIHLVDLPWCDPLSNTKMLFLFGIYADMICQNFFQSECLLHAVYLNGFSGRSTHAANSLLVKIWNYIVVSVETVATY